MPRSRVETWRRPMRWFATAALVTFVPKCLVCLAAYVGLGAALGLQLATPEMCGASTQGAPLLEPWLAAAGVVAGGVALWSTIHPRSRQPTRHCR